MRPWWIHQISKNINKFVKIPKYEILIDESEDNIGTKRNNLMKDAKGRYLFFLDDDDWIPDYKFAHFIQMMERNQDLNIVGTCTPLVWDMGTDKTFYPKCSVPEGSLIIRNRPYSLPQFKDVKFNELFDDHVDCMNEFISLILINHGNNTCKRTPPKNTQAISATDYITPRELEILKSCLNSWNKIPN